MDSVEVLNVSKWIRRWIRERPSGFGGVVTGKTRDPGGDRLGSELILENAFKTLRPMPNNDLLLLHCEETMFWR